MIEISARDAALSALRASPLPSEVYPGVAYRLESVLGSGSMAVAFRALRQAPNGQSFAVVKVLHPRMVAEASRLGELMILKESVALGRLNEQVPATPFVVRLLETSAVAVRYGARELQLPWLAMEYVHGGTLEERVKHSIEKLGFAFEPERAALCVDALARGLVAIHEVGVVHRDIKPSNILCCGAGRSELFKIADFGVSRARGLNQTFVEGSLGTPGYAAPEQIVMDDGRIGRGTDVFALAAATYYLLTGERLFRGRSVKAILQEIRSKRRRSVAEGRFLSPELRAHPGVCAALDTALAHATAVDARSRPQTATTFSAAVATALQRVRGRGVGARSSAKLTAVAAPHAPWTFRVRNATGDERALVSAAWDGAGCCLAVTTRGLEFWDGTRWASAPAGDLSGRRLGFCHYAGSGRWWLGGERGTVALYREGKATLLRGPSQGAWLTTFSGELEEVAVAAGAEGDLAGLQLWACVAGRWLKPLPLPDVVAITALVRLGNERWVVAGRSREGAAFLGDYFPLQWRLEPLPADPVRAYLGGAGGLDWGMGVVAGAGGRVVFWDQGKPQHSTVPGSVDLSAAQIDGAGVLWVASSGRLWRRPPNGEATWSCVWHDAMWSVPLVSIYAESRRVVGLAADGGLIEGFCPPQ